MLDRPPPRRFQTQAPHPAQETATRCESAKTPEHQKAEGQQHHAVNADTLEQRLDSCVLEGQDVETAWDALRETVYDTAMECLGPTIRKHKDWFDENYTEIKQLLEEKHRAHRAHLDDPKSASKKDTLRNVRSTIQAKLRNMQHSWLSGKVDEIQAFADRNDMKNFYGSLKELYGPTASGSLAPLLSADGSTLITDKEKVLERWDGTL